jgi:hypothetical protein
VSLFGAWQKDNCLILAMELCDHSLQDRLTEALDQKLPGIPLQELLSYMTDAATGLDALNAKQVQHRDVKPANLLLLNSGVKVADFGLAKVLEHTVATNSGAGTLAYTAPECFKGKLTQQTDQYSLAVTYYHLRMGRLLFKGDPARVMYAHLELGPDLSDLPPAEGAVVARALSKEPRERWPNCKEFVRELIRRAMLPAELEVNVTGDLYSRPADFVRPWNGWWQGWHRLGATPSSVAIHPDKTYQLRFEKNGEVLGAEFVPGLAALAQVLPLSSLEINKPMERNRIGHANATGTARARVLSVLQSIRSLKELMLTNWYDFLSDADLGYIGKMRELQFVSLDGASRIDAGLAHLRDMTELRELDLGWCHSITDNGLAHLRNLKKLRILNLRGCEKVTTAGIATLQAALPECAFWRGESWDEFRLKVRGD